MKSPRKRFLASTSLGDMRVTPDQCGARLASLGPLFESSTLHISTVFNLFMWRRSVQLASRPGNMRRSVVYPGSKLDDLILPRAHR